MAYIAQDEEENTQNEGMNVLGQQGMAGQAQQPEEEAPQAPQSGQPATIGANAAPSTPSAPTAAKQGSQGANEPKAGVGSGLFTNLRKYVKANQPAGKNIAGAITQKQGKQTQQLGQQVQQQQSNFQQRVAENRARQQSALQSGQQAIAQAGQGEQTAEDVTKFQGLVSGEQKYEDPGVFDVSKQNVAAQNLAQQAQQAARAAGTAQLLKGTFGDNRQYSRGQQALDELILAGAQPARQQMVEQLQSGAQGLEQQIRDARTQAIAESSALRTGGQDLRETLQSELTGAREGLQSDVEAEVEARRQALSGEQQQLVDAMKAGTVTAEQLAPYLDQASLDAVVNQMNLERQQLMDTGLQYKSDLTGFHENFGVTASDDEMSRLAELTRNLGFGTQADALGRVGISGGGEIAKQLLRTDLGKLYVTDPNKARQLGITPEVVAQFANQNIQSWQDQDAATQQALQDYRAQNAYLQNQIRSGGQQRYEMGQRNVQNRDIAGRMEALNAYLRAQGPIAQTGEDLINQFTQAASQQRRGDLGEFAQFIDPSQITAENTMTQEQLARQNALAALAGQQGTGVQQLAEGPATPGSFDLLGAMRRLGIM